ncbi:DUF397 domain-containing protein [Actinomadura craniellae]|uniref:DUF397 domain-containing protein n=1 Tax=Actinomadura craniellae TaxID=2231787 RepID=A0A365H2N6_9ACTN|nr:DUF397 domain-containing protein [Actinomadura craniellae]RAY13360.1 DUF397 domain-containing protein [Actinomadura craniellae]
MDVTWRKSSRSAANGGDCVELADLGSEIGIRDSKNPDAGHLTVNRSVVQALVQQVKAGDLDL